MARGVVVALLLVSTSAFGHGTSDLEGMLSIEPVGAKPGSQAVLRLALRELRAGAAEGLRLTGRLEHEGRQQVLRFTPLEGLVFESPFQVAAGSYELRIQAERGAIREVALLGFDVNGQVTKLGPKDSEVWLTPAGALESIPALDHLSGVLAFLLLSGLIVYGLRATKENAPRSPPPGCSPIALIMAAIASLSMPYGAFWDISFHSVSGRETFFSPPHFLIYGGIVLALAAVALIIGRKPRGMSWSEHFKRDPAASAAGLAMMLQLSSAPFDELWHFLFGLDVSIWSPPHAVLILGAYGVCLALASVRMRGPEALGRTLRMVLLAGALLAAEVFLAEFTYAFPRWHISQDGPAVLYPLFIALFTAATAVGSHHWKPFRFRLEFTSAVLVFLALRYAVGPWLDWLGQSAKPDFSPLLLSLPLWAWVLESWLLSRDRTNSCEWRCH